MRGGRIRRGEEEEVADLLPPAPFKLSSKPSTLLPSRAASSMLSTASCDSATTSSVSAFPSTALLVCSPSSAVKVGLQVTTTPRGSRWKMGALAERTSDESSSFDSSRSTAS